MEYRIRNFDTANLQSIEVLKGPAAILFGRGEPGGIIDIVVKRPLETPYYSVQQQESSYGVTRTTLDATGPLSDDKSHPLPLQWRILSAPTPIAISSTDRNLFIAPTLTFRPSEQFRVNVDFEYQNKHLCRRLSDLPRHRRRSGQYSGEPVSGRAFHHEIKPRPLRAQAHRL